jgi:hypothetical protein
MRDFQTLRHGVVAAFGAQLSGRLVSPADAGYDKARRVWNGRIDRRAAAEMPSSSTLRQDARRGVSGCVPRCDPSAFGPISNGPTGPGLSQVVCA